MYDFSIPPFSKKIKIKFMLHQKNSPYSTFATLLTFSAEYHPPNVLEKVLEVPHLISKIEISQTKKQLLKTLHSQQLCFWWAGMDSNHRSR